MLRSWEKLPDYMKTEAVYPYYGILKKRKISLFLKRGLDFVVSTVMFVILLPILLIISILIKLDSKGAVFYRQERVTQYGRKFKIFKFRTMVADADKIGSQVTVQNDSRVTKIGTFLRKYRLEGNDIIRQTTKSLINKGFREVSPILFYQGCNLISNELNTMAA